MVIEPIRKILDYAQKNEKKEFFEYIRYYIVDLKVVKQELAGV